MITQASDFYAKLASYRQIIISYHQISISYFFQRLRLTLGDMYTNQIPTSPAANSFKKEEEIEIAAAGCLSIPRGRTGLREGRNPALRDRSPRGSEFRGAGQASARVGIPLGRTKNEKYTNSYHYISIRLLRKRQIII